MSVFKRPGSPYYQTEFHYRGHRVCRSTRKRTEREARAEARKIKAEECARIDAERTKVGGLTLDQGFGKYWLEHGCKLAPTWTAEIERYIKHILRLADPDMLIENLSDAEVNDFVQAHLAEGGGKYALNRALAVWRGMHRRARKKWKQATQEIDWNDFFNGEEKRVRYLTIDEARRLLDCLPLRTALAVEWSLYTACRKFETFGLVWDDVHLDQGYADVTAKGGRRHRVWLSPQAMDVLTRVTRTGSRYVFDRESARYSFAKGLEKAAIENFRWHDLRHTAATWLRQAGTAIEVVQRVLGHQDVETTMRYAHVADEEVQEAVRRLPALGTGTSKIVSIKARKSL